MAHMNVLTRHWFRVTEAVFVHVLAIVVGFIMMVLGLGLGVTMIMLPVGVVVGLAGAALFVAGLFAHVNRDA
jgi:hypothetical protein